MVYHRGSAAQVSLLALIMALPAGQALAQSTVEELLVTARKRDEALIDVPFYLAQGEYAGIIDAVVTNTTDKATGQINIIQEQTAAVTNKALNLVRLQRLQAERGLADQPHEYLKIAPVVADRMR